MKARPETVKLALEALETQFAADQKKCAKDNELDEEKYFKKIAEIYREYERLKGMLHKALGVVSA